MSDSVIDTDDDAVGKIHAPSPSRLLRQVLPRSTRLLAPQCSISVPASLTQTMGGNYSSSTQTGKIRNRSAVTVGLCDLKRSPYWLSGRHSAWYIMHGLRSSTQI